MLTNYFIIVLVMMLYPGVNRNIAKPTNNSNGNGIVGLGNQQYRIVASARIVKHFVKNSITYVEGVIFSQPLSKRLIMS